MSPLGGHWMAAAWACRPIVVSNAHSSGCAFAGHWIPALPEVLAARQERDGVANHVNAFVPATLHPARYVGKSQLFEERQTNLNGVLALAGLRVDEEGRVATAQRARTASEAEPRAGRLRAEVVRQQVHADIAKACRAELLEENHSHAVLEATRSVAGKVRRLLGLTLDGSELVDEALATRDRSRRPRAPILALNTLRSISEQSEQRGMMHLMKGIFAVLRRSRSRIGPARSQFSVSCALDAGVGH